MSDVFMVVESDGGMLLAGYAESVREEVSPRGRRLTCVVPLIAEKPIAGVGITIGEEFGESPNSAQRLIEMGGARLSGAAQRYLDENKIGYMAKRDSAREEAAKANLPPPPVQPVQVIGEKPPELTGEADGAPKRGRAPGRNAAAK
jgi:hypothetical protein